MIEGKIGANKRENEQEKEKERGEKNSHKVCRL